MCGHSFALGLALSLSNQRLGWQYRLAGTVPEQQILAALPVMAALSVVTSSAYQGGTPPYVLGLEIRGADIRCEVDIALAMNDNGPAAVVVGEVKSGGTSIDGNDLANLERVQAFLKTKRVDSYVLIATLRDRLSIREQIDLRELCNACSTVTARWSLKPLLPIVLVSQDMSVPRYTKEHPGSWTRQEGLAELAIESCRRNLGLLDFRPAGSEDRWSLQWSPIGS
jgi:hypothetical protein